MHPRTCLQSKVVPAGLLQPANQHSLSGLHTPSSLSRVSTSGGLTKTCEHGHAAVQPGANADHLASAPRRHTTLSLHRALQVRTAGTDFLLLEEASTGRKGHVPTILAFPA